MANLLTYGTSGLTGDVTITDKQGSDSHHFIVTVTGNCDGTFTDLKASYQNWDGDRVVNTPFNVSGNVGTLTVYCSRGDKISITGKFEQGATPPTQTTLLTYDKTGFTGDVTITDKQGDDSHHFIVTVTGNGDGTFTDLKASYQNWDGDRVVNTPFNVSGNVGTLTVYCSRGDKISITGKFEQGATPPTQTTLLTYDKTGFTGDVTITDKQGDDSHHFIVTVTGNGDGTFTDLKASYENWNGDWVADTPFNVSGNVGTLTVYCSNGDEISITGKFISGVKELQITNNITNTTAKAVASETNYTVTVEACGGQGSR